MSAITQWWNGLNGDEKLIYGAVVAVPIILFIFVYFILGIKSFDQLIKAIASIPVWIIRKIIYFFRKLIESIINGIKEAFTKPL